MKLKVFNIRLTKEHLQKDEEELNQFLETVSVKKTSCQLINAQINYWSILVFFDQKTSREPLTSQLSKINYPIDTVLNEEEQKILDNFKIWRQSRANALNLPAYMICSNSELVTLVKVRPDSIEKLVSIKGFGDQKIAKFGEEIIAFLNSY